MHGDESGSVDRHHNLVGSRLLEPGGERAIAECRAMLPNPYVLDEIARTVVLAASSRSIAPTGDGTCRAAHVRSNHVHIVVEAEAQPERIMNQLTSERPDRKRWARHGSTRWLWKDEDVRKALRYVIDEQGEPMAVFVVDGL